MISVALALVLLQAPAGNEAILGPTLPSGSNEAFLKMSVLVEEKMEKGDFEGAKRLFRLLPKGQVTLAWDDSALPASSRVAYASARDRAIATWEQFLSESKIKVVPFKKGMSPSPEILVNFVPTIPPKEADAMPPGSAHFFSESSAEPRLEYVIALRRGNPSVMTDFIDVHNEVGHALSQYYGIARSIAFGVFSSRTDLPASRFFTFQVSDRLQARSNLDACALIAKSLMKGQRLIPTRPQANLDPLVLDAGQATQGDVVKLQLQVTNNGNSPLMLRAIPDCSCVAAARTGPIEAGETKLIQVQINLRDVVGDFDKNLIVYTNDVDRPVTFIPLRVKSKPLYRLLAENDNNVLMKPGGVKAKVFMVIPESSKLKPTAVRFTGIEGAAVLRPWSGRLADPDIKEPELPRQGYVVEVDIKDQIPPGRTTGTVWIKTDHPLYPEIYTNLFIQKGIIALPDTIRLGEIPSGPRRAAFLVSRPGKPFKILKITTDSPYVTAAAQPSKNGWEYRVNVVFDGKAPPGMLSVLVTVQTSDPSQPTVKVPFNAIVQ